MLDILRYDVENFALPVRYLYQKKFRTKPIDAELLFYIEYF